MYNTQWVYSEYDLNNQYKIVINTCTNLSDGLYRHWLTEWLESLVQDILKSRFKTTSNVFIRALQPNVWLNAAFDFINVYHFGGSTDDTARVKKSEWWKQEHIKKSTVYINF